MKEKRRYNSNNYAMNTPKGTKAKTKGKPLPLKCKVCKSYNSIAELTKNNGQCIECFKGELQAYRDIWLRRLKEIEQDTSYSILTGKDNQ
jgi:hypothetical protein